MATIVTELPEEFLDELGINQTQKEILIAQINRFNELNEKIIPNKGAMTDENGKLIFLKGTIIHGTSNCDMQKLQSIANTGIITGQAVGKSEDGETYYCADFHRVKEDISIEDYDRSFPYNDGRTPFGKLRARNIAFVIQPTLEMEKLLSYDCYRTGTIESEQTRTFVNGLPISEHEIASSILYGVPSSCFSGIILGDLIFQSKETIKFLMSIFPDCYIASRRGDVIYDPAFKNVDMSELIDVRIERCLLKIENEILQRSLEETNRRLAMATQNYEELTKRVVLLAPVETAAEVLNYQGDLESRIRSVENLREYYEHSKKL